MYTRRQMIGVVLTVLLLQGSIGLAKAAAARHSTHEGVDGVLGRAANIIL